MILFSESVKFVMDNYSLESLKKRTKQFDYGEITEQLIKKRRKEAKVYNDKHTNSKKPYVNALNTYLFPALQYNLITKKVECLSVKQYLSLHSKSKFLTVRADLYALLDFLHYLYTQEEATSDVVHKTKRYLRDSNPDMFYDLQRYFRYHLNMDITMHIGSDKLIEIILERMLDDFYHQLKKKKKEYVSGL